MSRIPFPSNENSLAHGLQSGQPVKEAWKRTNPGEPPPMMFQIQFANGRVISYAYSDLRETRMRDAGCLTLCVFGMEKYHITVEGRHLTELATLIGLGRIKSFVEMGPRTFDHPEESPAIDKITVETLTGPAY